MTADPALDFARQSLMSYACLQWSGYEPAAHHHLIAQYLEKVARGELKRLMVFMPPRSGKLVADSTPIMTDDGWKTHGELKVDSLVYGFYGVPTKVIAVSEKQFATMEVVFSNGEIIKCHENHEWGICFFSKIKNRKIYEVIETKELKKGLSLGIKYTLPESPACLYIGPIEIIDIKECEPEHGHCIQVDSPGGLYLVGKSLIPTHNSMIISEFFPAWYLGKNPDHRLVAVSHTQELAAEFGRKVRNQFNDPLYKSCFPNVKLSEDSSAADKFDLSYPNRGGYFAVGVGGALVGRGSHILLLDDLVKDADSADSESNRRKIQEWYSTVAYTRLMGDSATDDGAIVLVMQRWHPMDLAGFLLKEHKHENWAVLNFPAINDKGEALWPERFPLEKLLRIKKTLPARHWAALYQQQPYEEEGGIYKRDWWRKWPDNKHAPECDFLIQSWDTAFSDADRKKSSYSSCVTLGVFKRPDDDFSQIFLVDAWKKRMEYPELRKEVQKQYREHRPDKVIIEKKASGLSLLQDLRRTEVPISPYLPEKDKVTRAYAASSLLENGRIYYPDRRWARDFIDALVQFPTPEVDDLSDAFAQAIIWLQNARVILHSEDAERRAREEEEEDDIYADEDLPSNVRRMKPKKRRAAYG